MWTPPSVWGVPREYLAVISFCSLIIWPITENILLCPLLFIPLWVFGYFRSKEDPEFMAVRIIKYGKIKVQGKEGNEYYP
jgi:type IV secretory pathway VirB3-like protein